MEPTFSQVNLVTSDPEAALHFFGLLGLRIAGDAIWRTPTGVHHVSIGSEVDAGAAELEIDSVAFAKKWNAGWSGRSDLGGCVVLGFQLASRPAVDETYARLVAAGYRGLHEPHDAFWGARYAVVEGPDAVAVGLMSPRSEHMRARPPDV